MESYIEIIVEQNEKRQRIKIDNSTEYKDFLIQSNPTNDKKNIKEINVQISKTKFSDGTFGELFIEIGDITFSGFAAELFIKFINQNLEK